MKEKKYIISHFFYNIVLKFTLRDINELTIRFLRKKIISFETK